MIQSPVGASIAHQKGRGCVATLVFALAWSAFAFGAVYPWAYGTLIPLLLVAGGLGLTARSEQAAYLPSRPLCYALVAILGVGLLQLVPVPSGLLRWLSPETDNALASLRISYAAGLDTFHSLSIDPGGTLVGLALFGTLAILLVGLVRMFSITGVSAVADGVIIIGVTLALVGIVQHPLYNGRIYGLWRPLTAVVSPFGPFINRNHFAGWMLMALPVCLGSLFAAFPGAGSRHPKTVREWIVWLGSDAGNRVFVTGLAAATMGLSLVMTMSRSGITAFVLSLAVSGWFFARGVNGTMRKSLVAVGLALLMALAIGWTGTNVVAARFAKLDAGEFALRQDAWVDAAQIARAFPLTGTGLNTYGSATLLYQTADPTHHYAEAHNDYLQLAAEGGIALLVPLFLAAGLFIREAALRVGDTSDRAGWWIRRGAVTGLLAIAAQEMVDFSLQMPANAALFTVLCAMAIHRAPTVVGALRERATRAERLSRNRRAVFA